MKMEHSSVELWLELEKLKSLRTSTSSSETEKSIAAVLNRLSKIYEQLKDYENSLNYSLEALQIQQRIHTQPHVDLATIMHNVSVAYARIGQNEPRLNYAIKSVQMFRQLSSSSDDVIGTMALLNCAEAYGQAGLYTSYLEYALEAFDSLKINGKDKRGIAQACNQVGFAYSELGEHTAYLKYSLEALEIKREILPKVSSEDLASSLISVSLAYRKVGEPKISISYAHEALSVRQKEQQTSYEVSAALLQCALAYLNAQDIFNYLKYSLDALKMRERLGQMSAARMLSIDPDTIVTLYHVSQAYGMIGDDEKRMKYSEMAAKIKEQYRILNGIEKRAS